MADLLTMDQVCARLGCCAKTLRKHIDAGDIRYVLIGSRTRKFTDEDVREFIKSRRRRECRPSTSARIRRSGGAVSASNVIDIDDLRPSKRPGQRA